MLNKVQLIGFLGADPEVRRSNDSDAIARANIATSESWKKDGEKHEKTEWHRVVFFGKLAEIVGEYLKKGSLVYVEGRLQTRSWDKDGETRYTTEWLRVQALFLAPDFTNPTGELPRSGCLYAGG